MEESVTSNFTRWFWSIENEGFWTYFIWLLKGEDYSEPNEKIWWENRGCLSNWEISSFTNRISIVQFVSLRNQKIRTTPIDQLKGSASSWKQTLMDMQRTFGISPKIHSLFKRWWRWELPKKKDDEEEKDMTEVVTK